MSDNGSLDVPFEGVRRWSCAKCGESRELPKDRLEGAEVPRRCSRCGSLAVRAGGRREVLRAERRTWSRRTWQWVWLAWAFLLALALGAVVLTGVKEPIGVGALVFALAVGACGVGIRVLEQRSREASLDELEAGASRRRKRAKGKRAKGKRAKGNL